MRSLSLMESWPVDHAAAAVVDHTGRTLGTWGDQHRSFRLASVTKLLTSFTALIALEEGAVELDEPAGPPGSTVRHLLAHASGLDFSENITRARPGTRRIYSNRGMEVLAEAIADRSGIPFGRYVREGVLEPLGMDGTVFEGSPAAGTSSCAADLARFAAELQQPTLIDADTLSAATTVQFPGLDGVLPGFGRQRPNDWGLGFELRDGKAPHWTGAHSSPSTFGHFGQAGTFLWVDPAARAACVVLTDRDFSAWAAEVWPPLTDAVLAELAGPDS